jgi:hypothetical protein
VLNGCFEDNLNTFGSRNWNVGPRMSIGSSCCERRIGSFSAMDGCVGKYTVALKKEAV